MPIYANDMLTKRHLACQLVAGLIGPVAVTGCSGSQREEPVFCYRTLADVSCYLQPDAGREATLVGVYQREAPPKPPATAAGPPTSEEPDAASGWLTGVAAATVDLLGRVLAPVGPILGLFR